MISRAALWRRERLNGYLATGVNFPVCNLCGVHVTDAEAWHRSHDGVPRCFGGRRERVAHAACNLADGRKVTRAFAKSNRVRDRHIGLRGPGLGKRPMRAGVRSRETKTFHHGVQRRRSGGEKHAACMARRAILTEARP
jgi:hypothetical protein